MAEVNAIFEPGTNPDLAQVDVQNRIKRVESRLPQAVTRQGLQVEQANSGFLMIFALTYDTEGKDEVGLADFAARNVNNEIRRVPGVGRVQMFAAERALRIWVDPAKLVGYGMSVADVDRAIAAQNARCLAEASVSNLAPRAGDQRIHHGARPAGFGGGVFAHRIACQCRRFYRAAVGRRSCRDGPR